MMVARLLKPGSFLALTVLFGKISMLHMIEYINVYSHKHMQEKQEEPWIN